MALAAVGSAIRATYHQAQPYFSWAGTKVCLLATMGCNGVSKLASKIDNIASPRIRGWKPVVSWAKNHEYAMGLITGVTLCMVWGRFRHKEGSQVRERSQSPSLQ